MRPLDEPYEPEHYMINIPEGEEPPGAVFFFNASTYLWEEYFLKRFPRQYQLLSEEDKQQLAMLAAEAMLRAFLAEFAERISFEIYYILDQNYAERACSTGERISWSLGLLNPSMDQSPEAKKLFEDIQAWFLDFSWKLVSEYLDDEQVTWLLKQGPGDNLNRSQVGISGLIKPFGFGDMGSNN